MLYMRQGSKENVKNFDLRPILICTALHDKWPEVSENILFLGEWCKKYDQIEVWKNLSYTVYPYHWENRKKRETDYIYLASLYEDCLTKLATFLNKQHKINQSIQFWRIVIGPWLMFYISSLFDRFEMLRLVLSSGTNFNLSELKSDSVTSVAFDFDSFCNLMAGDNWNYDIYQRVLNYFIERGLYENTIDVIGKRKSYLNAYKTIKKKSKSEKLISFLDSILYRFTKSNKIIFFNSYFPIIALAKLHKSLKLNFSLYSNTFLYNTNNSKLDLETRSLKLNSTSIFGFEDFVLNNILIDLPKSYLELFSDIYYKSSEIFNVPEYIVTASSYWNNDFFKIWTARLVTQNKSKLLVLDHGGSFVHVDNIFDHESKISHLYVSWIKPHLSNQVQLPPNKYVGKKINFQAGSNLLIIGTEENRYAYKSSSTPISSLSLVGIELMINIIENLNENIQKSVFVRPYNNPDGWLSEKRIKDRIPFVQMLSGIPFNEIFYNTKLIICTQPQTSYTESLLTGLPTILVFEKKLYDFVPKINDLVNEMYECNMIFYDAEKATRHVNLVWENPNIWWESEDVKKCINRFFTEAVQHNENGLVIWRNFFKNLLN